MKISKKLSIFITAFVLVFGIQFLQPKETNAQFIVSDPILEGFATSQEVTDDINSATNVVTTGEKIWEVGKQLVLQPAVVALSSQVLDSIVNKTISWANNGFEGNPGFINNWGEFLKGIAHDTLSNSLNFALEIADQKAKESQQLNIQSCLDGNDLFNGGNDLGVCTNDFGVAQRDYDACIYGLDVVDDEEEYQFCEEALSFAEVAYDICVENIEKYDAQVKNCNATETGGSAVAAGNIAQANYNLWQSGEAFTARSVANTIISEGSKSLNIDPLTSIIKGEGNTLKRLLGSQQNINQFYGDIKTGGWAGYMALADPYNYPLGLQSIVAGTLGAKTTEKINSKVQDLQTPQKFLDKKECVEWKKNSDGSKGECLRKISLTPGEQVGSLINKSLTKDQTQTGELNDQLVTVLVNAIGDVTDGLIQVGLNKATNSFFKAQQATQEFKGSYQSEYDVLGEDILNRASNSLTTDSQSETINIQNTDNQNNLENINNSESYPKINLKKELGKNIEYLTTETNYYDDLNSIEQKIRESIVNMDQCLPGPDYKWEQRFQDNLLIKKNEKDIFNNKIALDETAKMFDDGKVNIPGSQKLKNSISDSITRKKTAQIENSFRYDDISNSLTLLNNIKEEIKSDFNIQKQDLNLNKNLFMFKESWKTLNKQEQIQLAKVAEEKGYLIIKYERGETLNSLIENQNIKVRDSILSMSWDIWSDKIDFERKNDLMSLYANNINNLSSPQYINIVKSKIIKSKNELIEKLNLTADCLIFKLYALGVSENKIKISLDNVSLQGDTQTIIDKKISVLLKNIPTNIEARTDVEIKLFTENSSLFLTKALNSPLAIANSILGFENEDIKNKYINNNYPDDDLSSDNKNAYSVMEIFEKDNLDLGFQTPQGSLFCRNTTKAVYRENSNSPISTCFHNWYKASDFDYQIIISNI